MMHQETTDQNAKHPRQYEGPSTLKKSRLNTMNNIECERVTNKSENNSLREGETSSGMGSMEFDELNVNTESYKDLNQHFNQFLDKDQHPTTVTCKAPPPSPFKVAVEKPKVCQQQKSLEIDVIDLQQIRKLVALGIHNTDGPWMCLTCGASGKMLKFLSYYGFRRHLVEVHHEKVIQNKCEYCGKKKVRRNAMLHHLYKRHGVAPPSSSYNFPKCKQCNYIALTPSNLIKHQCSHKSQNNIFFCNHCFSKFNSPKMMVNHIQSTGHKYTCRKPDYKNICIYCFKKFELPKNLYFHLKTVHKEKAVKDDIIDASDEEVFEISDEESEGIKNKTALTDNIKSIPKITITKAKILNLDLNPAPKHISEVETEIIRMDNANYNIQLIGVQESNNDHPIEVTHNDTPSENSEYFSAQGSLASESESWGWIFAAGENVQNGVLPCRP